MKMCEICTYIEEKAIFKDKDIAVIPSPMPCSPFHLLIVPLDHKVIIDQLEDKLFAKMMLVANRLAAILFESFQAMGTNIIVRNGVDAGQVIDHVAVEIIARFENDGLNFSWQPNPTTKEKLEENLKELVNAMNGDEAKEKKQEMPKKEETKKDKIVVLPPRIP